MVGGCDGVRRGDGVRNAELTPGRCWRFSSSA